MSRPKFSTLLVLLAVSGCKDDPLLRPIPGKTADAAADAQPADAGAVQSDWLSLGFDLSSSYFNPKEKTLSASNVGDLHLAWEVDTLGGVTGAPAVHGNVVYALAAAAIHAFDVTDGHEIWRNEEIGGSSAPTYEDGVLYVHATMPGEIVYAVDAETGKEKWHAVINTHKNASGFSSPVLTKDLIVVGDSSFEESTVSEKATFQGAVVALDKRTGDEKWRYHTVEAPFNGCAVWSTVSIDLAANTVFAVTGNNYTEQAGPTSDSVFALDLTSGTKQWQVQASTGDIFTILNPQSPDSDFGANPILYEAKVEGGTRKIVGAGQKSGDFWAFDRTDGSVVWKRPLAPGSSVGGILNNGAYDGERIYVASNGAQSDAPGSEPSNGETPAVYAPGGVSTLFALEPTNGDVLWERQLPAYVWAPITVANGIGFVAAETTLEAFDVTSGALLYSFKAPGTIASAPVIAGGRVFFGAGMQLVIFGHGDTKFRALSL